MREGCFTDLPVFRRVGTEYTLADDWSSYGTDF